MLEKLPDLLVTKLYIPPVRAAHVARSRLLDALDKSASYKVALVAAAAGFGKTTLVADWSRTRDDVAWVSLDEGDNDLKRFLAYLIAAVQTRHPGFGVALLAALQSPGSPAPEHILHSLINQLAGLQGRLVVVFDDFHVIENPEIHVAVAFLLDHLPPGITLLLLTRADPLLPLGKLRARHDLLELRAADLRFTREETEQFLNQVMGLGLSPQVVEALDARAEGWIAGLGLAALALTGSQRDQETFAREFAGTHRFILDYLIEEVLSRQPESARRFLLETSILGRLNGDLCSVVMHIADGQAMLARLERDNLFLIPLDNTRTWYRYHHLFADLLRARLYAEYPGLPPALYQRAAQWHEAHGLPEEAVSYALEAGDFEYAAELITGEGAAVAGRGEVGRLLNWYRAFPADFADAHPDFAAYVGVAFALNGRWGEAETLLASIDRHAAEKRTPESLHLAYLVASYRQDAARLKQLEGEAATSDPMTRMVLAMVVNLNGDMRRAAALMAEAQAGLEREGLVSLALSVLFQRCRLHVFLGELRHAYDLCQTALEAMHMDNGTVLPMATFAHVSLGRIFIEWNEPERARGHLRQAIQLAELSGFVTGTVSSSSLMLAETLAAEGDVNGASATAAEAITLAERYDPPAEVTWLRTYQARVGLSVGQGYESWLRDTTRQSPGTSLFYPLRVTAVTRARALLTTRQPDTAIPMLTRMAAEPADLFTVEILLLLALARRYNGDSGNALLTLEQALPLAEAENRVRVFLELGAPMRKLLSRYCENHPDDAFAQKVLAAYPESAAHEGMAEPLSEREREILRLIAAGHSNEEIADTLTLALSTVKWYINQLYAKLGVKSRSQAIALAHERRLLS